MTPKIELMKIGDVARTFSVHVETIRRWVRRGEFPPPIKVGHFVRWRISDIDAFLEKRRKTANAGNL